MLCTWQTQTKNAKSLIVDDTGTNLQPARRLLDGTHFQTAEVLTSEMEIGRCVHKLAESSMLLCPEKILVEGKMWQLEGCAEAMSGEFN